MASLTLTSAVDSILNKVSNLPSAPKLLVPLLAALSNPDTDLTKVVDMISVDPALTARLLQMCNCAHFNPSGARIVDIPQAIGRLGFQTVYRVVALARFDSFLRPASISGLDGEFLWKHAATVAFASQFVADRAGLSPDLAFTAGLLHDLGKPIMATALGSDYARLSEAGHVAGNDLAERERLRFGMDHAEVGAGLLERWEIGEAIAGAVRNHHDLNPASPDIALAACISVANHLAHELNVPDGALLAPNAEPHPAFEILEIGSGEVGYYQEEIQQHLEFVEALCRFQR